MHCRMGSIGGILPIGLAEELVEFDGASTDPSEAAVMVNTPPG